MTSANGQVHAGATGLARPLTRNIVIGSLIAALFAFLGGFANEAGGATVTERLKTAENFAVLAGSTITNANMTTIQAMSDCPRC